MISLIVPTRGRPKQVKCLMESLFKFTEDLNDLQVVLACDIDEMELANKYVAEYLPRVNFVAHVGEFVPNKSSKVNRVYDFVTGDIIGVLNDDMVCRTRGWDKIVKEHAAKYPDGIYLIYGKDGRFNDLAVYQFTSRKLPDSVGYIWHPMLAHIYMDNWNHEMFKEIGRLEYVPELFFEHMHYAMGKAIIDDTYKLCTPSDTISDTTQFHQMVDIRHKNAETLKNLIKEGTQNAS